MDIKVSKNDSISEYKVGHIYKYLDTYFTITNRIDSDPYQEHYSTLLLPTMFQGDEFDSLEELYTKCHQPEEKEIDATLEVFE